MPCVAQFGIIDSFERDKDYSEYRPEIYHCIVVDDDLLDDWWPELLQIKTFFHCYDRPEFGLARYGVTLIPPESIEDFYEIVALDERSMSSKELIDLMRLLRKARTENKYVIHYGV